MVNGPSVERNGQRIALWSVIGAVITGLIGYFSLVNIAQRPLEERIGAIAARVDAMATDTAGWRASFSAEVDRRLVQLDARAEERRAVMYDRLSSTDADRSALMIEFRRRLDAIDQDRAKNIGSVTQQLQQIREHLVALDKRSNDIGAAVAKIQEDRSERWEHSASVMQALRDQHEALSERLRQIEVSIGRKKEHFGGPR